MPDFHEALREVNPSESPGYLLWHLSNQWQATLNAALKPIGLTHAQFIVLAGIAWLEAHSEPIDQSTVGEHYNISKVMTSNIVKRLDKQGYIQRTKSKEDKRRKILTTTKKAVSVLKKAFNIYEDEEHEFFNADTLPALQVLAEEHIC